MLNALVKYAPTLNEQHPSWPCVAASEGLWEDATDGMWMARTQTDFEMKAYLKPKKSNMQIFLQIKTNGRIDLQDMRHCENVSDLHQLCERGTKPS